MFIFIASCAPVNNFSKRILSDDYPEDIIKKTTNNIEKKELSKNLDTNIFLNKDILSDIEIILPKFNNNNITQSLINSFELSIYSKKINNINLKINRYFDLGDLDKFLLETAFPGKVFVGTLDPSASKVVKNYCNKGIVFFSFASDINLAGDCVYLINFFPHDDLNALFNFFPKDSKIALLFPENYYGYSINKSIDPIASKSKSLIINRSSYAEDLSNARNSIKELSKYNLRKNELERQKKILKNKNDEISKNALKRIQKFETLGNVDFTHLILPDYGIRLLEIAPLLPFYDVDPNKVQFVGTGVWDDEVFFEEPSLQGAIFPGIEEKNRRQFFNDYYYIYKKKPPRTSTIPYDVVGLLSYIINKNMKLKDAYKFLDNSKNKFDGIDGKFFFLNNIIFRELDILQINNGLAIKLK
tara:strand:+ start:634 stop:1878 length:1245 start_codon:yes stop_codon:yes gene_type:complete